MWYSAVVLVCMARQREDNDNVCCAEGGTFGYIGGEYSSTDPVTTQKLYQIGLRSIHKRNCI